MRIDKMDINEFSFVVNICGGKDKKSIKEFLNKELKGNDEELKALFKLGQEKEVFDKNLKYSFENLVDELARHENMENFDLSKIEFEDY